jgi:hypothetical protein
MFLARHVTQLDREACLTSRVVPDGVLHQLVRGECQAGDDLLILEHLSVEVRHEAPDDGNEAEVGSEFELEEVGVTFSPASELEVRILGISCRMLGLRGHATPLGVYRITHFSYVRSRRGASPPWVTREPFL